MKSLKLIKLFALLLFCLSAHSAPLDHWHWVAPLPQGNSLREIQFVNGRFVAVGERGTVVHSVDALSWVATQVPSEISLLAVTYGNGTYVVGGEYGMIWMSDDLQSWTQGTTPTFSKIQSVTYGNGNFIAVTDFGEILKSADGISWLKIVGPMFIDFRAALFAQGYFWVAGGHRVYSEDDTPYGVLMRSTDGNLWEPQDLGDDAMYTDISEAGDELLVTEYGTALHIRSAAGGWRQYSLIYNSRHSAIIFGNGKYIAYGIPTSDFSPYSLVSTNGYLWNSVSDPSIFSVTSIAFGNGHFVAAGLGGLLQRATDGEHFEPALTNQLTQGTYYRMVCGNGRLILTGYRYFEGVPEGIILAVEKSGAGYTLVRPEGMPALQHLEWTGEKFIGAGYTSLAMSADGLTWSIIPVPGGTISGMAIGPDRIVCATSENPSTITVFSLEGVQIFHDEFPELSSLSLVQFGMGSFWAIGNGVNSLFKSTDGITWELVSDQLPLSGKFCAQGGRLVILGYDGISASSLDGVNWQLGATGTGPGYPRGLRYLQNRYIAVMSAGSYFDLYDLRSKVASSTDGVNWQVHDFEFGFNGVDIAYDDGRYYISGLARENVSVMESDFSVSLQLTRQTDPSVIIDGPKEKYYRVLRSPALGETADWMEIDQVFAPQMPFTYQDSTAIGSGPYFYRVTLEPEPVEE